MMYVKVPAGAFNKEKVLVGAFLSQILRKLPRNCVDTSTGHGANTTNDRRARVESWIVAAAILGLMTDR